MAVRGILSKTSILVLGNECVKIVKFIFNKLSSCEKKKLWTLRIITKKKKLILR